MFSVLVQLSFTKKKHTKIYAWSYTISKLELYLTRCEFNCIKIF